MYIIGKIDKKIYGCITDDISVDEVIITDERLLHIKEHHPRDYEKVVNHIYEALRAPDYIFQDTRVNTGLIVKLLKYNEENIQVVLRLHTSQDQEGYKNSIISCWKISNSRLRNYIRNKKILYRRE